VPKAKASRNSSPTEVETWVKTAVVREIFSLSYGFISTYTKPDSEHPDRPVMPCLRVGREMRFRVSEVQKFLENYNAWYHMTHTR